MKHYNDLSPDIKFDLQLFGEEGDQSDVNDVIYEIDGEQVPYSEMTPDQFSKVYDTYKNQHQFSAANTQKTQALAKEREEFDAERESIKQQMDNYSQWEQYLHGNPELYQYIMNHVQTRQQMPGQQQVPNMGTMGPNQEFLKRFESLEKRLAESEGRLGDNELNTERTMAMDGLKQTYGNQYNETEFLDYFTNKIGDLSKIKDMYNVIFLASVGAKHLAGQQKMGAGLETGTGVSGNVPEKIVVDENQPDDPIDQVVEKYMKIKGIED